MTNSQKHEVKLIIRSLNNILEDVDAGERVDIHGLRQEEVTLIRDLLSREISSPVKISTPVKDEEE
jgi:hypothetical protein